MFTLEGINKAPGYDKMPISVIQDCLEYTLQTITDVRKAFNSLCYPNYRIWVPPTKLFYGSKVTLQTDNSSLVLQLHCQNHSLSHMAYLRTQFSAQRFSEELGWARGGASLTFFP